MKNIVISLVVAMLASSIISCSKNGNDVILSKVMEVKGDVRAKLDGNGSFEKLKVGATLYPNAVIVTKSRSICKIQVGHNIVTVIKPRSVMRIKELTQGVDKATTKLAVDQGKALFKVKKLLKNKQDLSIITPTMVAGVRGTEFLVGVERGKKVKFAVASGKIAVRNKVSVVDDAEVKEQYAVSIRDAVEEKLVQEEIILTANKEVHIEDEAVANIEKDIIAMVEEENEKVIELEKEMKAESSEDARAAIAKKIAKEVAPITALSELKVKKAMSKEKTDVVQIKQVSKDDFGILDKMEPVDVSELKGITEGEEATSPKDESVEVIEADEVVPEVKPEEPKPIKSYLDLKIFPERANVTVVSGKTMNIENGYNEVDPDSYTIKISKAGYLPKTITVSVAKDQTMTKQIVLKKKITVTEKVILLDSTEIMGKVIKQNDYEVIILTDFGKKVISRDDIEEIKLLKK